MKVNTKVGKWCVIDVNTYTIYGSANDINVVQQETIDIIIKYLNEQDFRLTTYVMNSADAWKDIESIYNIKFTEEFKENYRLVYARDITEFNKLINETVNILTEQNKSRGKDNYNVKELKIIDRIVFTNTLRALLYIYNDINKTEIQFKNFGITNISITNSSVQIYKVSTNNNEVLNTLIIQIKLIYANNDIQLKIRVKELMIIE